MKDLGLLLLGTTAFSLGLTGPGRISIDQLISPDESWPGHDAIG